MLWGVDVTPSLDGKPYADLARLLRGLRDRAGLSQAALSQRTPPKPDGKGHVVGVSHIGQIETGDRGARPPTINHLARALGLSEAERQQLLEAAGYADEPPDETVERLGRLEVEVAQLRASQTAVIETVRRLRQALPAAGPGE